MTIQGAVYELEQMLSRKDIPDYLKPTIKKVVETIVDEFSDRQAESKKENHSKKSTTKKDNYDFLKGFDKGDPFCGEGW